MVTVSYVLFKLESKAIYHAAFVNKLFAKRGHTLPVVEVVRSYDGFRVVEIVCQLPG